MSNSRSINSYEKIKSIGVNRGAASRTREGISLWQETLFPYTANRALADIGNGLNIHYRKHIA